MAEIVVFHHAQGRTDGVVSFGDHLRSAGHTVHVPDLYDGRTFDTLTEGVAHAQALGFDALAERGMRGVDGLDAGLVSIGFSLGVVPAQRLAQTRPGARGAVLCHAALPPSAFGGWPDGVPVQIHVMADDPWAEEDRDAIDEFGATVEDAEVFTYRGAAHLFADPTVADHDPEAAGLLLGRVLEFLDRC